MRRFHLPDISGETLTLDGEEARHASTVLRAREGTELVLFDGRGNERPCRVVDSGKRVLTLEPLSPPITVDRRPQREITVAVAYPKARARSLLTEKLVELGVRRIIPLLSERGAGAPDGDRILREAIGACKQCGINTLPEISPAQKPGELDDRYGVLILLDAEGNTTTPVDDPCCLVVGPEGGFSEVERKALAARRWGLGSAVLRVETACLAAIARLTA